MDIVLTSKTDLERIVDERVEAANAKLLSRIQPGSSGQKEWLTNREAQDFLGLSKATLQRYRDRGILPYSKIGGSVFYRYRDVVAVLEEHLVERSS